MKPMNRRHFIATTAAATAGLGTAIRPPEVIAQIPGERPQQAREITVLRPQNRAPISLIIDDSTALVNLAYYCIPQFHEIFPDQYPQPWKELPQEIPDAFVQKFAAWCGEQGVKGKYSVVPYPGCVGWLDRLLPGWSREELDASLNIIRTELASNWDFHPEMISHTRVIDIKTGRPYPEATEYFMENWRWTDDKSVDQIAAYMAYALTILKNVEIPCEGITTPGGFGNRVLPELAQATLQACREVFHAEIPHYFRHLFTDDTSVAPRVEYASGLEGNNPQCVVSIIGCTGDWFGGWDGLEIGSVDRLITEDLQRGRLPEVIEKGEPAILVCHWPGIYFNGYEVGFKIFQEAVRRVHERYDNLIWMKLSEISRYWAAKELTKITLAADGQIALHAPFACPSYTLQVSHQPTGAPQIRTSNTITRLQETQHTPTLEPHTWRRDKEDVLICFDLPKGESSIQFK